MRGTRLLSVMLLLLLGGAALVSPLWAGAAKRRTLTIAAASSLTEFMAEAGPAFEKLHPDVKVECTLASSSVCRVQIEQGAPVDLFLSADKENMDTLTAAKIVKPARSRVFAHNKLAVMVGRHAKSKIRSLADLADDGLDLVIATPESPIGKYTRQMLRKAGKSGKYGNDFEARVLENVVSLEPHVKATLARVLLGDGDAAICYATDITPDVRKAGVMLEIPDAVNVIATYPIGIIERSKNRTLAQQFVDFVLSKQGQDMLRKHGFMP
jgi:molybdate transport system substrate-binding protein